MEKQTSAQVPVHPEGEKGVKRTGERAAARAAGSAPPGSSGAWREARAPAPHYCGEGGSLFGFSRLVGLLGDPEGVVTAAQGSRRAGDVEGEGRISLSPPPVPLPRDALPAAEDSLCVEIQEDPAAARSQLGGGAPGRGGDS